MPGDDVSAESDEDLTEDSGDLRRTTLGERPADGVHRRPKEKAEALAGNVMKGEGPPVLGGGLDNLMGQFDLVINAISAGLHGEMPALPDGLLAEGAVAYDMVYGSEPTPFMRWAQRHEAAAVCDGLGMLVEQAAEAFQVWRGWRPDTAPVLAGLRGA